MINPMIRPMALADLTRIVPLHRVSFPNFFLTELGPRFLCLYYQELLRQKQLCLVVCKKNDLEPLGFATAVYPPLAVYRQMLRHASAPFVCALLGALVRQPHRVIPRVCYGVRWRVMGQPHKSNAKTAHLTAIAVHPKQQTAGLGSTLLQAMLKGCKERGASKMTLETDADHNEAALHFYQKNGFVRQSSFTTPQGRRMYTYEHDL